MHVAVAVLNVLFALLLIAIPAVVFPFFAVVYRRILEDRRLSIIEVLSQGETFQRYVKVYRPQHSTPEIAVQKAFDRYYHPRTYILPVTMTALVTLALMLVVLAKTEVDVRTSMILPVPREFIDVLRLVPGSVIAAGVGAWVWGAWDVIKRYRTGDLLPESMHYIWLRILITGALGYLLVNGATAPLQLGLAFGIGIFPLRTVWRAVLGRTGGGLRSPAATTPADRPNLQHLQGATETFIHRVGEEGINSTEHLAHADPVKLLLRTGLPWKMMLDMIDQAILFNYVGNRISKLREMGIRGAIELANVGDSIAGLNGDDERKRGKKLLGHIADKLEIKEDGVHNLIHAVGNDPQVTFVWGLWDEATVQPA